jgi:ABC-type transporter Mla subunit MlaD
MEPVRFAKLLAGAAVVAALALAASACGGSGGNNDTTTTTATTGNSATVAWASGVCNSFGAWRASLQRAKASLGGSPTSSDVQNAGHQAQVATQALASSLQQLGKPPGGASATVQQSIATLRTQLQSGRKQINDAVSGSLGTPAEVKSAVSSVRTTANGMLNDFTSAVNGLKALDPKSDLEKAFHQAVACQPFFT